MRIAVAQLCSSPTKAENLPLMRAALEELWAADGPRPELIVFPEATMASFVARSADAAEPLEGPFADGVRTLATEFGTTIAVGMFTPGGAGLVHDASATPGGARRCRNTLFVTGVAGEWSYDKLHLFDAFGFAESDHVVPGDAPILIDVGGVRIGLALCYDIRFPELFTTYARAGAHATIVAASWQGGPGKVDQWRLLARARALDSTSYVVACGQAEPAASGRAGGAGPLGVGHSLAAGPDGVVLHEAGDAPEVFVVEIDPDAVARVRAALPVLANARSFVDGGLPG